MNRSHTATLAMLAFAALPAAASHYIVLVADEASRTYALPPPLNSARLSVANGSLSIWIDQRPLRLDYAWLKSFGGAQLDTAVLARDPGSNAELYVLIDCVSGRLVLEIGDNRGVKYHDEECHDV